MPVGEESLSGLPLSNGLMTWGDLLPGTEILTVQDTDQSLS